MQKPSYYAKLAIDPLEYSYKNKLNPYQFNSLKYITRYKDKNGIEDLRKAIHCIDGYKKQLSTNNIHVINCIDETLKDINLDAIPVTVLPNSCKIKRINSLDVRFAIDPYEYAYKNKIGEKETNIIRCIMLAKHKGVMDNLDEARRDLIELCRSEEERGRIYHHYKLTPEQKSIVDTLPLKRRCYSRRFFNKIDNSYKKGDCLTIKRHDTITFSNNESINVKYGDCIICLKDQDYVSGYEKNNWLHLKWTSRQ